MTAVATYLGNIWKGFYTTMVGMGITVKYLVKKPVTVQYPDEQMPVTERYRGIHYLEQDKCIYCFQCARACPVDCIEMDAVRDKKTKTLDWKTFTLDYQKCMFCELCVYPCPEDCIHEGKEFAFVAYDRSEFVLDLLTWKGFDPTAPAPASEEATPAEEKPAAKKPEKAVKAEAAAKPEAPAKAEKSAEPDKPAKAEKPPKAEKPAKAENPAKAEPPGKAENPAKEAPPAKPEE